ncbi:carcinoembryonic antigen-related cell adhesion molecule 5-like [Xenia sp. Carnegie-2017]|uniref:carcinoembryonic antigen-related cell adhesion molecule 5-like n=1 Tax=Xenia sp. Carnegie-2017 TaxID=2897299 RepID=UPI001F0491D6|nr:carcinoembryonic antigen-related cell adhesion molecule 5-like [Xenia sp. Carnegie-2017]
MAKFGFLSFVLLCWISSCQGVILSPPPANSFTFLPGETENITWTFDDDLNDLASRNWLFTGSSTGSQSTLLATVTLDLSVINLNDPILPNYDVYKPSTLRLRNITHSYDGTYEFQLTRRGSASSSFISKVRVFVAIKPNVAISCSTPLVVNEGDNVSCVCRGEGGNPPAKVTWFDKDNNIIGDVGVVNKTLVITNVTVNNGGNYTCKAQSYNDPRFRDEKSIEVKVKATYPPQQTNITISPMSVKQGQTVTITCESDGYPEPTYTIYHNGAVISNNKTYIIQSVNFNHAGSYRCEAKNKLGNDLSDVKNLTIIKGKIKILLSSIFEIVSYIVRKSELFTTCQCSSSIDFHLYTIVQDCKKVNEGDNVSCVCRGEGGNPPANVTWFDKDNARVRVFGVESATLVIPNVAVHDNGSYTCKAQSYDDPGFRDQKSIEIQVKFKPTVSINCSSPLFVNESDNVSCVCRGEGGHPPANVTWFDKDNTTVRVFGVESATLVIPDVNVNDNGSYRCKAQSYDDPGFRDQKSIEIQVKFKPTVSINCSSPLFVNESDSVSCVCRGEGGIPPANVTWFVKDSTTVRGFGVESATLVIPGASPNDRASYRCKAESFNDPRFIDEKSIEIIVNYKPRTTTITLSKINPKIGESVIITCESDGYPEPTYTIYHNGAVISNNKTYIIQSVNFNHAGSYRCEAKNKLGNDLSDVKNLTIIKVKPNVIINCSTPLVVNEGDNVSCVCRGEGGNPPANVIWFDKDNNIIGDVGVESKTLVITNVTLNDGGNYTCKAQSYDDTDYKDEKSIEITVTPTYPPQQTNITISPMSVKKGQNVTITCESDGYPEPTYTIYHNGAVISNKKTYIIQSVNFNNAGSYRCEATNKLGNDLSDVKNLTVVNEVSQNTSTSKDNGNNNSTVKDDDDDGPNIALIVGIAVGAVFLVAIIVVVIFCCRITNY